jgi:hypothetical protein
MEQDKQAFNEMMVRAAGSRTGFGEFMEWLNDTDFFTAPASSKYHGAAPGMLLRHSLNVRKRLMTRKGEYFARGGHPNTMTVVSLLHDVNKIGRYEQQPGGGYKIKEDGLPIGHGEKSVIMIQQHGLTLTIEEIVAIRWHMGAFDDAFKGGANREMSAAFERYPLALMLHLADMEASYLDEERG